MAIEAEATPPLDAAFEVELPPAPYPGLRPFEKHEWPIFFGREEMTDEVIHRLIRSHLVVVHGDSGCGKSSLIRAGVLAQLEQEHARSGLRWRTCAMQPREAPLRNLAESLAKMDGKETDRAHVREIRRRLNLGRDAPAALAKLLRRGDDDHVCILVDQFEELFSFARKHGRNEAQLFADILVGLQAGPPPGLYAVPTMRSEFLGVCARFGGLAEAVNETQYLLPQMERPALMRAIREPSPLYGGEVSRELARRLIADAGGGQDQLPVIQHGLMWLWRKLDLWSGLAEAAEPWRHDNVLEDAAEPFRREAGPQEPVPRLAHEGDDAVAHFPCKAAPLWQLGLEDYRNAGDLASLLSKHAAEVMVRACCDPGAEEPSLKRQKTVEHLFRALTEINADGHAVRRPQTFAELREVTGSDEKVLRDILDHFRAEGVSFLTPYGNAPIGPKTLIDISHEALIRSWGNLADERDGWLQREFEDGLIWKTLRLQAQKDETLSAAATEDRDEWLKTLPSPKWCERYGGGWEVVQQLMETSRQARKEEEKRRRKLEEAKRREAEERARRAEQAHGAAEAARQAADALATKEQQLRAAQARRARLAVAAALVGLILTAIATGGVVYALQQKGRADLAAEQARVQALRADLAAAEARAEARRAEEAVIKTKAASYWNGLQLWNDPLRPQDVTTLWNLAQEDDTVRVAFVRQLANNPALLAQFGFKPEPVARAVGLVWPDEAREIVEQSVDQVASDQFDPNKVQAFELVSYARVLSVLPKLVELDQAMLASGTEKIAGAIEDIAGAPKLTDQQLWALAELVGVGFESESVEAARNKLREILRSAEPSDSAGWRGQALSRAIEAMAPDLTLEERSRAVDHLTRLLGQNTDSWAAKAHPRALTRLLAKLDRSQANTALSGMPPAIARAAVQAGGDSSYLLTLMVVAETLAEEGDQAAVDAFGEALITQFSRANEPLQRAALARAAIPLLPRLAVGETTTTINRQVANITSLAPNSAILDPDRDLAPVHRSLLRESALSEAADALSQAVSSPEAEQRRQLSEVALQTLRAEWSADRTQSPAPFLRAAQARLLAEIAPSLTEPSAVLASTHMLAMLRDTSDFVAREAIARALAGLAPKLSNAEHDQALEAAKAALAATGSTGEASAWARAIAALLPDDPGAATADIVEVLKYPTATAEPTDILLAALAKPWPDDYEKIEGMPLPDADVWEWLEEHLPKGHSLIEPPSKPDVLRPEGVAAAPG